MTIWLVVSTLREGSQQKPAAVAAFVWMFIGCQPLVFIVFE
jgi:hypothetical protein